MLAEFLPGKAFPILNDIVIPNRRFKKKPPVSNEPPIPPEWSANPLPQQAAVLSLATLKNAEADRLISFMLFALTDTQIQLGGPSSVLFVDLLEAAESRKKDDPNMQIALDRFYKFEKPNLRDLAVRDGGDAERGKAVFTGHRQAQCVRCHKVGTSGGEAAPDLSHVASRDLAKLGLTKSEFETEESFSRQYLLESLLTPSAKIAPGYGTVTFLLTDGTTIGGIIKSEKDGVVNVITPDNKSLQIKSADIEQRSEPKSAMPAIQGVLSLRELRDVVEYLSTLK